MKKMIFKIEAHHFHTMAKSAFPKAVAILFWLCTAKLKYQNVIGLTLFKSNMRNVTIFQIIHMIYRSYELGTYF